MSAQTSLGKTGVNSVATLIDIGSFTGGGFVADAVIDDFEILGEDKTPEQIYKRYSESIVDESFTVSGDVLSCSVSAFDNTGLPGYNVASTGVSVTDYEISISVSDTSVDELNDTLQAGKPTKLSVLVENKGVAVANATVRIVENDGFSSLVFVALISNAQSRLFSAKVDVIHRLAAETLD